MLRLVWSGYLPWLIPAFVFMFLLLYRSPSDVEVYRRRNQNSAWAVKWESVRQFWLAIGYIFGVGLLFAFGASMLIKFVLPFLGSDN
jgi:hypothetical protein